MDGYFSFNSVTFPAPSLLNNPTPVIQLVDPTLYTLTTFFGQLLKTNLQPRFSNEAMACGLTNSILDNWVDNTVVGQMTDFPLHSLTLETNDFKFPMLNVVIENESPHQDSLTNSALIRDFCVSWVLPPLTPRQYNKMYQWLGAASKVWTGYGQQGYDPKINQLNVWHTINVAYGSLNSVSYDHFYGFDKAGQEADFPAVQFRLSLVERQQLPVPQNYPTAFSGVTLDLQLVDGYNPANPIDHFIDGYVFPTITLTSTSVSSGTINGGTWFYLYGTGFDNNRLQQASQISINGSPAAEFAVKSPGSLLIITNPGVIGTQGQLGNITVTDLQGHLYLLANSWTYI